MQFDKRWPETVLIIAASPSHREAIEEELNGATGGRLRVVDSHIAAMDSLRMGCDALLVCAQAQDEPFGRTLLHVARELDHPPALFVVACTPHPDPLEDLAVLGAAPILTEPACWGRLATRLREIWSHTRFYDRAARVLVGRVGLKDAISDLRGAMVREALSRSGGSHRAAARLLEVDRRYIARVAEQLREQEAVDRVQVENA